MEELNGLEVNRRGFLLGSLGGALTVTTSGLTGLILSSEPSAAASKFVVNVMGSYSFTDVATGCKVAVTVKDGIRRIVSNGIPNHVTGAFPNSGNPNKIIAQSQDYSLPTSPVKGADVAVAGACSGVAINGVLLDPATAEYYNNDPASGWNLEAFNSLRNLGLDSSNAHVNPTGTYHYHGTPVGLEKIITKVGHSSLVGWSADGFPIYLDQGYSKAKDKKSAIKTLKSSYKVKSGTRPNGPGGSYNGDYTQDWEYVAGSGDLDAANGRFQVTPEFPKGTYCYILTKTFPLIPRRFVGTVASSFVRTGPGGGPQGGGAQPGGNPPQQPGSSTQPPDLAPAAKKLGFTVEQLQAALGPPPPNLDAAAQKLGISVSTLKSALGLP
jgi:hypothetical protein